MPRNILLLPGDGIGPEIVQQAARVLEAISAIRSLDLQLDYARLGGAAYDAEGSPYPASTAAAARRSDAILLGAVGGPQWAGVERHLRPEQGLLDIRADLDLFANLRPALLYPQLADASSLKPELVAGLDILIVRELTGGIYFGQPRGIRTLPNGERQGFNTDVYSESEIRRIAKVGFELAQKRGRRLCSVDKANVLEVTLLWREVVTQMAAEYPDVEVEHLYVDNAAMQLVIRPKQFDVILTGNLFGDILSDEAAMLTGSIGMLPSASMNDSRQGLYEPCHGSAPDIAGQGIANPLATILSAAMLLRYSLDETQAAEQIERAVSAALDEGLRTPDIWTEGTQKVGTAAMAEAVIRNLDRV